MFLLQGEGMSSRGVPAAGVPQTPVLRQPAGPAGAARLGGGKQARGGS